MCSVLLCLSSLFNIILFIYLLQIIVELIIFKHFCLLHMVNFVRSEFVFQLLLLLFFLEFYFLVCFRLLIFKVILNEALSASLFCSYFLVVEQVCCSSPLSPRTLVQNQVLQGCFSIPLLPRSWGYSVLEPAGDLGSDLAHEALDVHLPP